MSVCILIIAYVVVLFLIPDEELRYRFSPFGMLGFGETENGVGRIAIWKSCITSFLEKPFLGYGGGSSFAIVQKYYGEHIMLHNVFLESLVELGLIGFIFLSLWFVMNLMLSFKKRQLLASLFISVAFVYAFFLGVFLAKFFWLIIILSYYSSGQLTVKKVSKIHVKHEIVTI